MKNEGEISWAFIIITEPKSTQIENEHPPHRELQQKHQLKCISSKFARNVSFSKMGKTVFPHSGKLILFYSIIPQAITLHFPLPLLYAVLHVS